MSSMTCNCNGGSQAKGGHWSTCKAFECRVCNHPRVDGRTFCEKHLPECRDCDHPCEENNSLSMKMSDSTQVNSTYIWVLENITFLMDVANKIPWCSRNPDIFLSRLLSPGETLKKCDPPKEGQRFHVYLYRADKIVADSVTDNGVLEILGRLFSIKAMCVIYLALVMKHRGRNWDSRVPTFDDILDLFNYISTSDTSAYPVHPPQSDKDNMVSLILFIKEFKDTSFVLP